MEQNANKYPRKLNSFELNCLYEALPENKSGYLQYRNMIEELFVLGDGRFGNGNFILGEEDDFIDLDSPSSPIFAIATISLPDSKYYVAIHEEHDGQIEIDIKNIEGKLFATEYKPLQVWTYSTWVPGQNAPNDNSVVREVHLIKNDVVLAIAPTHKKIWVYNSISGIVHFVPVTNFYNEVMLYSKNKDTEKALNPGLLFTNLDEFTDEQLINGFLIYNKDWDRIELDQSKLNFNSADKK